jgi:hypothetical protein
MDRGRVGEDRGSKETDGCPLTVWHLVMVQRVGEYMYGPGENMGEKRRV